MTIKIGLCGFTIGAAAYVKQFEVVEVQQTFYDPRDSDSLSVPRELSRNAGKRRSDAAVLRDDRS
jgi:hypothetical protein